ncbi:MAG: N-acetyltransferase [Bacteroidetes bacterium]|nr:MAG: N-acetyltransferase [Bacteroidota bacterium]
MKPSIQNSRPEDLDFFRQLEIQNDTFVCAASADEHRAFLQSDNARHLSIFDEHNRLIGFMLLIGVQNPHKSLELRRIVLDQKNRGYGRQALRWAKKYCFETLRFHRLWLDVYTDNARAIRLYESEGFLREGTRRECLLRKGTFQSLHLYAMLEKEYHPAE